MPDPCLRMAIASGPSLASQSELLGTHGEDHKMGSLLIVFVILGLDTEITRYQVGNATHFAHEVWHLLVFHDT